MILVEHFVTSNCFRLISVICKYTVGKLFSSYCLHVYGFHLTGSLNIKHVINIAATSKAFIKHKLLSVHEKLDIEHGGGYLKIFLTKDTVTETAFLCKLNI